MKNYYNLDGIKTELKKEIDKKESLLAAWKVVTFPAKKDGKPFANMGKNIDGAKYQAISCAMQAGEYELKVYAFTKMSGYVDETIPCYNLVKHLKDEKMLAKTQNYQPKQTYLEQVYTFDLDDIKNAIAEHIKYLEDRITTLQNELNIVDKCYNDFKRDYTELVKNLATECAKAGTIGFGSNNRNDIYYAILETVQNDYSCR